MPRIVAVTGASGGIGRAVVRAFAERGDTVALMARGETGLQAAAQDVRDRGGRALAIPLDVADYDAVADVVQRIESELGPIDVWVNVAFSTIFARFWQIKPEEFKRTTEVTYLGFMHGAHAVLGPMMKRNRGTIVFVGSALGYRGIPLQSAYCGAKHAIKGMFESLRAELMHEKSKVNLTMVLMPAVNTPQFSWVLSRLPNHAQPVPPIYQPEVAADAVVYAADHPRRRQYWVGYSTVGTLLGERVAPGLLDRYLARTGFKSQQTNQKRDPHQPANLWEPADGPDGRDFGAHGIFDDKATSTSPQLWLSHHHGLLYGVGAAAASAAVAGVVRWARR